MHATFHKTTQGLEEISTRAHGLSVRLRRCLILIDGQRTVDDLKTLLSHDNVEQMLAELQLGGYITHNDPVQDRAYEPPQTHRTAHDTEFDAPTTVNVHSSTGRRPLSLQERRHRGVRLILDLLGPDGEDIAVMIERCEEEAHLNTQLEKAYGYIQAFRSKAAADKFRGDVRLPPY